MPLRVLRDQVLVRRLEDSEEKTPGGIIIPDTAKEKPSQGEIVNVGPLVENVSEGDKVMFGKWSGSEIKVDDESLLIMLEQDLLAKIS